MHFMFPLWYMWSQFTSLIFPQNFAANSNCNYAQNMTPGVNYYIYNNEYPSNYQPLVKCRWILTAPQGHQVSMNCSMNIKWSAGCVSDKLLVSTNGDVNLVNANTYCGQGNMSLLSTNNVMTVGFKSNWYTSGGTYLCSATTYTPSQSGCDCGWNVNTERIVGGVEAEVNEFPSMAALYDLLLNEQFCGATIIATNYALTAAHCLINKQVTTVGMLVGNLNLTAAGSTPGVEFLLMYQFLRHPGFNASDPLNQNDIAILQTQTPIVFSNSVGPVCLPFAYAKNLFTGETATFAGWGTIEFMGPKSDVLLKTNVTVTSPDICTNETDSTMNQLCTYTPGVDACQADSGGPLYWTEPNTYRDQLIGIISTGIGCATTTPSVNTRVTAYLNWILQTTPDASYCVL